MKNVVKTSKWLRWTAAGAFGLMLTLNVMVGLDFEKGALLPTVTLSELNSQSIAWGESGGGKGKYEPTYYATCCDTQGWDNCVNYNC